MVGIRSLWIPILASAVIAFVASFILHMLLPLHRGDLKKVRKEDDLLDALRRLNIPAGDYAVPHAGSPEAMKDPAFIEKMKKGPTVFMTISPGGEYAMGKYLAMWFVYQVAVSGISAYVAGRALPAGAHYLAVFRFAGCAAFLSYAMALPQHSIWYRRNWGTTIRSMIDGLIYAVLVAGTFGWLWPR